MKCLQNALAYLAKVISYIGKIFKKSTQGTVFTTLHFLSNLQMGPISYCATLHKSGKACQGQKTLAYYIRLQVTNKMKCREYNTRSQYYKTFYGLNLRLFIIS
jgi:hypothetical protein